MSLNTDKLNGVDFTPKPAMPDIFWIAPNMSVSTKYIKADIIEQRAKVAANKLHKTLKNGHKLAHSTIRNIILEALSEKHTTISDI